MYVCSGKNVPFELREASGADKKTWLYIWNRYAERCMCPHSYYGCGADAFAAATRTISIEARTNSSISGLVSTS